MRWQIFLMLNTEGLYRNSGEENVKLRIFTWWSCSNGNWRNLHKSVMHAQSCCFAKKELKQERQRGIRKRQLKSVFALLHTLSRVFHHVQFVKCWRIFVELNSKGLYQSSEREKEGRLVFASSTKREIRQFHVVVVQRRQRKVQKGVCTCKVVVLQH